MFINMEEDLSKITKLEALEILDSRGNPTIEVKVTLKNGIMASGIAPSGASTGSKEACELRDKDTARYHGKGVLKACKNVETEIALALYNLSSLDTKKIDSTLIALDGTKDKSRLGANAMLATSIACAKAAALFKNLPLFQFLSTQFLGSKEKAVVLPAPMMNIINGGVHASSGLKIQEFMIMPISAKSFAEAVRVGAEVFQSLKKELAKNGFSTNVGDEGGFAPNLKTSYDALNLIESAVLASGYKLKEDIVIALDAAASEFYKDGKYFIDGKELTSMELLSYYTELASKYPIFSIEDAFFEDDYEGFKAMTKSLGNKMQIVGDDLFCTNVNLIKRGVEEKMANALLVKCNQIGTLTETLDAMAYAFKNNYNCIASHRSGESEDVTIAHLAVATNCGQIKTGSLARTDRTAKYNELIRIEKMLGERAIYAGKSILKKFTNF